MLHLRTKPFPKPPAVARNSAVPSAPWAAKLVETSLACQSLRCLQVEKIRLCPEKTFVHHNCLTVISNHLRALHTMCNCLMSACWQCAVQQSIRAELGVCNAAQPRYCSLLIRESQVRTGNRVKHVPQQWLSDDEMQHRRAYVQRAACAV